MFCLNLVFLINLQVFFLLLEDGYHIVSWQGVRAAESPARAKLPMREDTPEGYEVYRPLLNWSARDVFDMHKKYGIEPNPLYSQGMSRVGCMPCINVNKSELFEISRRFPEQIERIAEWERVVAGASKRGDSSFLPALIDDDKKDIYDWVDQHQSEVDKIITGTMADEKGKFSYFIKNKDKYPKVELKDLPVIIAKEDDKFSATEIRKSKDYMTSGKWIPSVVSKQDKQDIIDIVTPKEEPSIEDQMADTIDEVFAGFFPETIKKKQIKEGASGTPIAASSAISSKDRADLVNLYQDLRKAIDTKIFNIDFQQDRIYITGLGYVI